MFRLKFRLIWGHRGVFAIFVTLATQLATPVSQAETSTGAQAIPTALIQLGAGEYYSPYAFVVDKDARRLSIWNQKDHKLSQVAEFPIDFGRGGGKKSKRGDLNTPEGIYFLMKQLDGPTLDFKQYGSRAFTTNYPNLFDERDGKTGNGIWLHAVPDDTPLTRGSRGCVVVRNEVIQNITKYVKLQQTPLVIFGHVPNETEADREQDLKALHSQLDGWKAAWEARQIDSYMSFYSAQFDSLGMNKEKWQKYKNALNQEYKSIQVRLSEPVIYRHDDQIVMRFLQAYQSDKKSDYGEKTLYWHKEDGKWQIIAEQWNEVSNPVAFHDLSPFGAPSATASCPDCKASDNTTSARN